MTAVMVAGERYELAKARVDLAEAEAELAAAASESERAMALERVEDARCRIARWRRADLDRVANSRAAA